MTLMIEAEIGVCGDAGGVERRERSKVSQVLTARKFVAFLSIGGWWNADINHIVAW